jgi:hypothetical protein
MFALAASTSDSWRTSFSHQWFGDRVRCGGGADIWLNEGFATYTEWLWSAHTSARTPQRNFLSTYHAFEPSSTF